ncbi:hypothetical protein STRDD11_01383 [Streptococcus sp. DD11]|uniref:hypothetical protein n=1 Tax=Streptococcus sp. DD11 TaxID=1777879 RepID=UPI0007965AE9|nr:hypothetical protein [Streptococcus sp. DD11]KXT83604.1 hypothetical protein STRDD11_01383 [Streptococcus sp. DD11]
MKKKELADLALGLGLSFDEKQEIIYGKRRGFTFYAEPIMADDQFAIFFSVGSAEGPAPSSLLAALTDVSEVLLRHEQAGHCVAYQVLNSSDFEQLRSILQEAIEDSTRYFEARGLVNVCEKSGSAGDVGLYQVKGELLFLLPSTYQELTAAKSRSQAGRSRPKEHYMLGIAGAFLGSLLGSLSVFILAASGIAAIMAGILVAVLTLKGYQKFAKRLSLFGAAVSLLLAPAMSLLAFQLQNAQTLSRQEGRTIFEAFDMVNHAAMAGQVSGQYWANGAAMLLVSVIALLVAISAVAEKY